MIIIQGATMKLLETYVLYFTISRTPYSVAHKSRRKHEYSLYGYIYTHDGGGGVNNVFFRPGKNYKNRDSIKIRDF